MEEEERALNDMYYTLEYDEVDFERYIKVSKENKKTEPLLNDLAAGSSLAFGMKYLINEVAGKFDQSQSREIIRFLQEAKPTKSKWASTEKVGLEPLYEACEKVLAELKAYVPYSVPFLTKVNKREVPDYYDVIKNPMDLGTVGKKLKAFAYNSKQEFIDDLNLIWSNCFQYNVIEGNVYVLYAHQMKAKVSALADKIPESTLQESEEFEKIEMQLSMSSLPSIEMPASSEAISECGEICEDENALVNSFREEMIETRMKHILMRKEVLKGQFDIFRDSDRMGEYYGRGRSKDCFPELDYFADSFPSLQQPNHLQTETSMSMLEIPSIRPSSSVLNSLLLNIKELNEIRSLKRNLDSIREDQIIDVCEKSKKQLNSSIYIKSVSEQAGKFRMNSKAIKFALSPLLILFLESLGFESIQQSALSLLINIFSDHFNQLGCVFRFFQDSYCKQETEKLVELTLRNCGHDDMDYLYRFASESEPKYYGRLSHIQRKLFDKLARIQKPEMDSSIQDLNDDDFFSGRFAEELGLDIFGLRELGLEVDKVPSELFYPKEERSHFKIGESVSANKEKFLMNKFPTIKTSDGHIELLRQYIEQRIDSSGGISEEESLLKIEKSKPKKIGEDFHFGTPNKPKRLRRNKEL